MKIAFISNFVEPTGGDNILYNHASGLQKMGHQVDAYFNEFLDSAKEHNEDWNSSGVNIILYCGYLHAHNFRDYDIVIGNGLYGAERVIKIDTPNKAWFCQNFDPYVFGRSNEIDEVYRYHNKYLLYCHDLGKIIKHYYGDKKFTYCNNGIDYQTLKSYQKTNSVKNKRVCFMAAYYRDYKGINFANEIFGLLKERGFTTVEINATTGPLPNTMEFHKNPSFEEKCKLVASCGVSIHPSAFETWGLVPMESMALGVPVVGVNSRGIMEYAVHAKNALVYEERKPKLIADAINMLSGKGHDIIYEDLQKEGIKTAKEHDWETIMPEIEQSYKELCE